MKPSENPRSGSRCGHDGIKPPFRPAKDDTKPVLQDPILRSDPIETEEAVLLLPPKKPLPVPKSALPKI